MLKETHRVVEQLPVNANHPSTPFPPLPRRDRWTESTFPAMVEHLELTTALAAIFSELSGTAECHRRILRRNHRRGTSPKP
jgi:hypothetical protein